MGKCIFLATIIVAIFINFTEISSSAENIVEIEQLGSHNSRNIAFRSKRFLPFDSH